MFRAAAFKSSFFHLRRISNSPEARSQRSAKQAGLDPYCVYMGFDPKADFAMAAPWGFDAVSHYAAPGMDAEFAQLARKAETDWWAAALAAQVPYVPLVTTGWDKHPRRENPVSWERGHDYHAQTVVQNSTANNCTVAGNSAGEGGGAMRGELNNCIVYYNSASLGPNVQLSLCTYSCAYPRPDGERVVELCFDDPFPDYPVTTLSRGTGLTWRERLTILQVIYCGAKTTES